MWAAHWPAAELFISRPMPKATMCSAGSRRTLPVPGRFRRTSNVSGGQTGPQIASGEAAVKMSAFFTSYLTDSDIGNLHVEFQNSVGASLGTLQISATTPITTWHQKSKVDARSTRHDQT